MIRYQSTDPSLCFNAGRKMACSALQRTLALLYRKPATELSFRDTWLRFMSEEEGLVSGGWYSPPPFGAAVLADGRMNFDSLRNPAFWPSDAPIDWENGYLFVYASPVNRRTGTMGDVQLTLYFGKDEKKAAHMRNCRAAAAELFASLESVSTAAELYRLSGEIFASRGLRSNVISRTDRSPSNLGHTFETIGPLSGRELSSSQKRSLSSARRFLNAEADWPFEPGQQFTVEPQLVSAADPSLPKISQHYLVLRTEDGFTVCDDIDSFPAMFGQE